MQASNRSGLNDWRNMAYYSRENTVVWLASQVMTFWLNITKLKQRNSENRFHSDSVCSSQSPTVKLGNLNIVLIVNTVKWVSFKIINCAFLYLKTPALIYSFEKSLFIVGNYTQQRRILI